MVEQQDNPKQPRVRLAALVFVFAAVAFAAAFYLLDGMQLVEDLLGGEQSSDVGPAPSTVAPDDALDLPEDMPEEFALRVWQEQIDSQANIKRLIDGEVTKIAITSVVERGDDAVLGISAVFSDGTSAPGALAMKRFAGRWYFSYVTGLNGSGAPVAIDENTDPSTLAPDSPLPSLADVDAQLLNTIIAQQTESSSVLEEYATGIVQAVVIDEVVDGPGTYTVKIEMSETHGDGYGEIVIIEKLIDGQPRWFVARFTKTGSE